MNSQAAQSPPASQAQRTAEAKAAFTASLNSVGSNLDADLQSRARNIHANSKALSNQEQSVDKEIKKLAKQSDQMQKVVDKTKNDLAEFNSLQNFEAGLGEDWKRDLMLIEETLRIVEEQDWSDTDDQGADEHANPCTNGESGRQ
jgi:ABC-type transporter Mla subunit MlaD